MRDRTWKRVEAVVDAAAELGPTARDRLLSERCAGDPELRREAERILRALDAGGDFLDRASWAPRNALREEGPGDDPTLAGRRLGPYRIESCLGRGGMGAVYRAWREDGHYRREVALKVLRRDLGGEEPIRRFRVERQVLAQLSHPNIADLLDGGATEDGRPYLVMELVDGVPIDAYCDRHRLSVEERLKLFLKVCDAVHYAHRHLVVHRDLKPSNILVTAEGTVKLLDFGIAKLLDAQRFELTERSTRTGLRPLTLPSASPEQVLRQSITTASDVYALGVLLFRLLTGRGPYRLRQGLAQELEEAIVEQSAERPSDSLARTGLPGSGGAAEGGPRCGLSREQLRQRLRGDLDTIVLMALRKQPRRRYGSAQELGDDIERHLAFRPVAARPDTLAYRTSRFVRRHPFGILAGLAAVVTLVGFLAFALWQASRIARERDLARQMSARQEQVSDFLLRLFENANPRHEADAAQLRVRDVLDRARRQIDQLEGLPEVQATYLNTMGEAYRALALYDEAAALLQKALDLRRRVHGSTHLEVAESLYELGGVILVLGDLERAEALFLEALDMRRHLLGDGHPEVASCLNQLGLLAYEQGGFDAAESKFREALDLTARSPSMHTADSLHNLALIAHERGRFEDAEALYREALAMTRRLYGPVHPDVAISLNSLAVLLHDKEDYEGAEAMYREALEMRRRLFGEEHHQVATSLSNLALLLRDRGDDPAAASMFREALGLTRKMLGPDHLDVSNHLNNLALILHDQGDHDSAEAMYREALLIRRRRLGDEHSAVAVTLGNLAALSRDRGDLEQAEGFYREALVIDRNNFGDDHPDVAYTLHGLGEVLFFQGDVESAEKMIVRAREIRRRHFTEDHSTVAATAVSLARIHLAGGDTEAAEEVLRRTLPGLRRSWPGGHWRLAYAEVLLAVCLGPEEEQESRALLARGWPALEELARFRLTVFRDALALTAAHYERRGDRARAEQVRARMATI